MINNEKNLNFTVGTITDDDYVSILRSKLQRSRDDIKNGRVMTLEESKERMRKKYADFNVK